jgi:hypothetical protein
MRRLLVQPLIRDSMSSDRPGILFFSYAAAAEAAADIRKRALG